MDRLTQEEGERCARILFGKPRTFMLDEVMVGGPPRRTDQSIRVYDAPNVSYQVEELPEGHWTRDVDDLRSLPLDPYFWFGRLWDKLELDERELAMFAHPFASLETRWCISSIFGDADGRPRLNCPIAVGDHPCITLCRAIEALKDNPEGE